MTTRVPRLVAAVLSLALLASACGGDSGSGGNVEIDLTLDPSERNGDTAASSDAAGAGDDEDTGSSGAVADGPLEGLVLSSPTFDGSTLWVVNPDATAARQIEIDGAEWIDVQNQPLHSDGVSFALGYTTREGQSFAHDVSLVRIDRATGTATAIADLGFDRETDDGDSTSHELLAATPERVIVGIGPFGGDRDIYVFDATTGTEIATYPRPVWEETYETGSCGSDLRDIVAMPNGRIFGRLAHAVAELDPDTGALTAASCADPTPNLRDYISDPAEVLVLRDGDDAPADAIDFFTDIDLEPDGGLFAAGDSLWTIASRTSSSGDSRGIAGAIVRYDLDRTVADVYPLGELAGRFVDCPIGGDSCEVATFNQPDAAWVADRLVLVGNNADDPLIVLDPATGQITSTQLDAAGYDEVSTDLYRGDPDRLWLQVTRRTVTENADGSRSASGPIFLEVFDPVTGQVVASAMGSELFF